MRHLVRVTLENHHQNYNGYSRFGLRAINKRTQGDRTGRLQEELSATGGLRRWLRRGRIYAESWWQEENPHQSRRKTYIQNLDFGKVTQEASPQSTLGANQLCSSQGEHPPPRPWPHCVLLQAQTRLQGMVVHLPGKMLWFYSVFVYGHCIWKFMVLKNIRDKNWLWLRSWIPYCKIQT